MDNTEDIIRRFNRHDWTPEKGRTAVLLVDLQEYFREIIGPILENIVRLVSVSRKTNIPLVFTQHGHEPGSDHGMLGRWWADLIIKGTDEALLIPELGVETKDRVIPKNTYSAFYKTGLAEKLGEMGVTDLVIGGVMTNLCCETTARDAFVRGFRVFFLADGTSTVTQEFHLASLSNLGYGFATLLSCGRLCEIFKTMQG
jgi:nicotinamidase-related amidase